MILLKGFIKVNVNINMIMKNVKNAKYTNEYTNVKVDLIINKCLCCNWNYQKRFDEDLKKLFVIFS